MAFTAQTFRRVLKRKPSTPENLQAIRDIMVENISTIKAHHDSDNFTTMADILRALLSTNSGDVHRIANIIRRVILLKKSCYFSNRTRFFIFSKFNG
jgi:hypothetical protein